MGFHVGFQWENVLVAFIQALATVGTAWIQRRGKNKGRRHAKSKRKRVRASVGTPALGKNPGVGSDAQI
jgi:hypothetical protein